MAKTTAMQKIVKYMQKRKTGATAPEIAKYAKVNINTARKLLGSVENFMTVTYRKCRVTGTKRMVYSLY